MWSGQSTCPNMGGTQTKALEQSEFLRISGLDNHRRNFFTTASYQRKPSREMLARSFANKNKSMVHFAFPCDYLLTFIIREWNASSAIYSWAKREHLPGGTSTSSRRYHTISWQVTDRFFVTVRLRI